MRPNKQQPKYITTRPKWKEIVTKSHEGFDKWLYGHSCVSYYDGVYDAIVAAMLALHDDHHFGPCWLTGYMTSSAVSTRRT